MDPNGTLFSTAAGLKLAGGNGTLTSPEYAQSGFKVLRLHSSWCYCSNQCHADCELNATRTQSTVCASCGYGMSAQLSAFAAIIL